MSPHRRKEVRKITEMISSMVIPDRKLGSTEAFFHHIHEGLAGGFAVLCVYVKIAGPLEIQLVKHACHHLYGRHPLLRARIDSGDNGPRFVFDVPFSDIPVHSFFELGKTSTHSLLEREADMSFDASKHLWRVLLITDKTSFDTHHLVLSLHHSISDPACAVFLVNELLSYCAKTLAHEEIHVEILPVRPPLEELIAATAGQTGAEKKTAKTDVYGHGGEGALPFNESTPLEKHSTRFHQHVIEPAALNALRERCARKAVTVTGILAAAAYTTMQRYLEGNAHPVMTACVDLRKTIASGAAIVGPWCGSINIRLEYDRMSGQDDLWQLAKLHDAELDRITSDRKNILSGVRGADEAVRELLTARQFRYCCMLTDLGQVDMKPTDPFIIESVNFTTGRRCAEHVMYISAATMRSSMFLNFAFTAPLIPDRWATRFINSFLRLLDKAGK